MRFESEMISPLREHLSGRWDDAVVLEEFGVGYGVADLVAARPSPSGIARRRKLGQTTALSQRAEIQVLRALQNLQAASFDQLLEHTRISPKRLRYQTLRFLLEENYIEQIEHGVYQRRAKYSPVAREIWAVEAKMKNWFEGLCQARRYQHFAHRVYLAIFAPNRDRVRDQVLRDLNVGLIAVAHTSTRILFHPRRATPRSEELFLLSNERIWDELQIV